MSEPAYRPVYYRLSDEDRAKFGGPEWVKFDRSLLFELDAAQLMDIENCIGATIGQFLQASIQGSAFATKAMVYIARKLDGGMKEEFSKFNPHIFKMETKRDDEENTEDSETDVESDPTEKSSSGSDSAE